MRQTKIQQFRDPKTGRTFQDLQDAWVLFHIRQLGCGNCPLSRANNGLDVPCPQLRKQYPEVCALLMGLEPR